jgi:hypothetical protein
MVFGILYFVGMPDFILMFSTVDFCRFGPTKRHDLCLVCGAFCIFNGMFGILHFVGMPCFVLTFGMAKPTDAIQFGILCVWHFIF